MPIDPGTALAAGSALGSYLGSGNANRANAREGHRNRFFQRRERRRTQEYMTEMSNTAHQREVKDLEAAGLNPLLALKTGASTPSSSGGQGSGATMENEAQAGISAFLESKAVTAQIGKQTEETKAIKLTQDQILAQTLKTRAETGIIKAGQSKRNVYDNMYKAVEGVQTNAIKEYKNLKKGKYNPQNIGPYRMPPGRLNPNKGLTK